MDKRSLIIPLMAVTLVAPAMRAWASTQASSPPPEMPGPVPSGSPKFIPEQGTAPALLGPYDGQGQRPGTLLLQGSNADQSAGQVARAEHQRVQVGTYSAFGPRDVQIWQASTQAFVHRGDVIFHSAKLLGGTVGVSCDMCHPDAANTHPETYPKYQVQLGRVALLRDMINWCIENPVRGKPFRDDDVRLKALEAYILAQRKGVALNYGQH